MRTKRHRRIPFLALYAAVSVYAAPLDASSVPAPPESAAVSEPTEDSALVWARCADGDVLRVSVDGSGERSAPVETQRDRTARVRLDGLRPGHEHRYRARCARARMESGAVEGRFRTAPRRDEAIPIRFAFGGDIGGQNVCRDATLGYPVFTTVADTRPDFFLALGDMIYADNHCLATGRFGNAQIPGPGPARTRADFWAHWRYNRADAAFRSLLASTAYYPVWDDHEVQNDFGPKEDLPLDDPGSNAHLLPPGRAAFLDYNPIRSEADASGRLHRSFRWGKNLELLILDTRQHRDANAADDVATQPKSLLGRAQRDWLVKSLIESDAIWKVVVSSVPISIPTGTHARDGWANAGGPQGFERELRGILDELRGAHVAGLLWLTTDVHFATAFRYRPFPDDPGFELHEIVTGPMHAGLFPNPQFDPSFGPTRLFFYAPKSPDEPRSLSDALRWFNFGVIEISAGGDLSASVVDANGATRARIAVPKPARSPREPAAGAARDLQ